MTTLTIDTSSEVQLFSELDFQSDIPCDAKDGPAAFRQKWKLNCNHAYPELPQNGGLAIAFLCTVCRKKVAEAGLLTFASYCKVCGLPATFLGEHKL